MDGILKNDLDKEVTADDQKMPAQTEHSDKIALTLTTRTGPWIHKNNTNTNLESTSVKNSRKKDKNKPKRPLSAYNFFFKDERIRYLEEEKERGPTDTGNRFLDMSREIGRRWMHLSSEQRKHYEALAEEAMFRYQIDMEAYKTRKKFDDANLLYSQVASIATATNFCLNSNTKSRPRAQTMQSRFQRRVSDVPSTSLWDHQNILDRSNNCMSVQESSLRPTEVSVPQIPIGIPGNLFHQAIKHEEVLPRNDSMQMEARRNLLDHLLLERMAQCQRQQGLVANVNKMKLNALLNAQRSTLMDQCRRNHDTPPLVRNDSRLLYESIAQSIPSSRVQIPSISQVYQPSIEDDTEAKLKKELLDFVRQQQNPQWAAFLNMKNPNPKHR